MQKFLQCGKRVEFAMLRWSLWILYSCRVVNKSYSNCYSQSIKMKTKKILKKKSEQNIEWTLDMGTSNSSNFSSRI